MKSVSLVASHHRRYGRDPYLRYPVLVSNFNLLDRKSRILLMSTWKKVMHHVYFKIAVPSIRRNKIVQYAFLYLYF